MATFGYAGAARPITVNKFRVLWGPIPFGSGYAFGCPFRPSNGGQCLLSTRCGRSQPGIVFYERRLAMREPNDGPERIGSGPARPWRNWFLIFLPLFVVSMIGIKWLGFAVTIPLLIALLICVLLYQRYVKKRGWGAIMWGRADRDER